MSIKDLFQPTILFAFALMAVIVMMILPVPSWVLDIGLAMSFGLAILIFTTTLFIERLCRCVEQFGKRPSWQFAVIYMDMDDFKMINDHMGHGIGDLLLKQVSNILKSSIRSGDSVSRLGGDEFAIILRNLKKPDDAAVVSKAVLHKLSQVFKLEGKEVYTNANIGIAVYPYAGKESIDLVKNAESAMYDAKNRGKNQFRFYTGSLNQRNEVNLEIVNGIRKITKGQQLFLEYQPIIDIGINQCVAAEALIRWDHPVVGRVPPDNFLPFAEEYGMMHKIGEWVFKQAMEDYGQLNLKTLFISINMSVNELDGSGITDLILDNIKKFNLEPHQVVLELTETAIMKDPEASIKNCKSLLTLVS